MVSGKWTAMITVTKETLNLKNYLRVSAPKILFLMDLKYKSIAEIASEHRNQTTNKIRYNKYLKILTNHTSRYILTNK